MMASSKLYLSDFHELAFDFDSLDLEQLANQLRGYTSALEVMHECQNFALRNHQSVCPVKFISVASQQVV